MVYQKKEMVAVKATSTVFCYNLLKYAWTFGSTKKAFCLTQKVSEPEAICFGQISFLHTLLANQEAILF